MSDPVEGISAKLQSALAAYVKEHRLPGATAGVVHDGVLAWSGSVGFADVATRVVADSSSLHRVASITKGVPERAAAHRLVVGSLRG